MPIEDLIKESDDLSVEQIINELIRPENIGMKTEIPNVAALEALRVFAEWLRVNGLGDCADIIENVWIRNYLIDMVSNKRQSRKEIIDALISYQERVGSFTDRLMGGPK